MEIKIKDLRIDGDCVEIILQKTKTSKEKISKVVIKNYDFANEIKRYIEQNELDDEDYLINFINKSDKLLKKKISYTACYMLLRKIYKKAGLKVQAFATHSFRLGNVSQALISGVSIDVIKSHLRHQNIATTIKYKKDFDLVANNYANKII